MPLSPDEVRAIMERHRWRPGERDEMQADIAERREQNAEAQRVEQPAKTEPPMVIKQRPLEMAQRDAAMTASTQWAAWVKNEIRTSLKRDGRIMESVIADVVGSIAKKQNAALDELRTELAVVKNELSQVRAEAKVSRAIDEVQARLDKLEQTPRPALRTIGKAVMA